MSSLWNAVVRPTITEMPNSVFRLSRKCCTSPPMRRVQWCSEEEHTARARRRSAIDVRSDARAKRAERIDSHAAAIILQGAIDTLTN